MRLSWPLPPECNRITQRFGERPAFDLDYYAQWGYPSHPALDIACDIGTDTYATHDGWTEPRGNDVLGEHIRVHSHDGLVMTRHSHLSKIEVTFGQHVRQGERIGLTGATGWVIGDHLDFALKIAGAPNDPAYKGWIDPMPYLRRPNMTKTSAFIQRIEGWMEQALIDLNTNWVKLCNPPPGPDPMPRIPNKVVRLHTDAIDDQYVLRGETGGRDFVRHMFPQWLERPWATCYSLACGPNSDEWDDLQNLRGYSMGAMWEASTLGVNLAILDLFESHPTGGNPYDPEVRRAKLRELLPAVRLAGELGHYVALQAYWRPRIEGPLGKFHALGDLLVKVKMWEEMGLDLSHLRLFVSEWGIDGAVGGNPYEGWQTFVARGEITEQEYIDGLLAGEAMARKYPWLLALFKFVYGYEGQWQSYDHDEGFVRNLVAAMPNLPVNEEPVNPPAIVGPTDEEIRNLAWNSLGVPYTPGYAFPRYAREHDLGAPLRKEDDHKGVRWQPFMGGIVKCVIDQWSNTTHIKW